MPFIFSTQVIFSVFVFIFGLIIGSFLNCLIWRLYKNETLGGRSYCPKCRQTIAWYDNIPLLSFCLLGGRCRHCQALISWQYPLVELATAVLFLLTFWADAASGQFSLLLLRDWLLIITFVIIFVYDFRWQLVPMAAVWPLGAAICGANLLLRLSWKALLFFAIIGAVFFLIQYLLTRKKGIGEGDIWLGALLGLSFPSAAEMLLILVLSYSFGAFIGLILLSLQKKGWKSQIAFGPFLALGAVITLIWGNRILAWYLQFCC
ncbi:MAG: prepilin peptidase [Patescibacteria group bacterium]